MGVVTKPCTTGGDPSSKDPIGGTKKCTQRKDASGHWVNEGPYTEWFPNGNRALQGEFHWGKKQGKWLEWNPEGKLLSEKFYEDGVEVPRRDAPSKPSGIAAAAAVPEASPSP